LQAEQKSRRQNLWLAYDASKTLTGALMESEPGKQCSSVWS
jgi:hypothetical protein